MEPVINNKKNPGEVFDHVFIIMFENEYRKYVMDNIYFRHLADSGVDLTNYYGVLHPSQPNYIASIAGELCNVTGDGPPNDYSESGKLLNQKTIVDLIEGKELDWRAYMQSYNPNAQLWSEIFLPGNAFPYVIKHNPFSSFKNIVRNEARWQKVQNEDALFQDLYNGTLPAYSWFTPNMWNDGHYENGTYTTPHPRAPALVDQAATWLESFFCKLKFPCCDSLLPPKTLVVVTFDEADYEDEGYNGVNQVYTVLLGDVVRAGTSSDVGYNHYSLLKTIERNFDLGDLGKNDKDANWFKFLWNKTFQWQCPKAIPLRAKKNIACTELKDALYLIYETENGVLDFVKGTSPDQPIPDESDLIKAKKDTGVTIKTNTEFAVCTFNDTIVLSYVNQSGYLSYATCSYADEWSDKGAIGSEIDAQNITIAAIDDGNSVMIAYTDSNRNLYSVVCSNSTDGFNWKSPVKVSGSISVNTQSGIALGVLGASVMLMYQEHGGSKEIMVFTYNTASYNTASYNAASHNGHYLYSQNKWSPNSYPVAIQKYSPNSNGNSNSTPQPYLGKGPLLNATLDGVLHLAHLGVENNQILTETFSIPGILTSKIKIEDGDGNYSNEGYGTLNQVGWSKQTLVNCVKIDGDLQLAQPAAMTRYKDELVLLFFDEKMQLNLVRGAYV